jgi:tRNA-splicing ligase RtcB
MKVYEGNNVHIKSWCNNPEEEAIEQAKNLARLPFIFRHVCLMPDVHKGYGMPIGGVIACERTIIPNAVGVDIGCGMCAIKTDILIEEMGSSSLDKILVDIKSSVPLGFNHHREKQDDWLSLDEKEYLNNINNSIVKVEYESSLYQIGTLGGGNHFIEIQKGHDGYIWIMLHSGSRNLGYKIAKYYNKIAQELCLKWYSNIPKIKGEDGLAFLPIDSKEGEHYKIEMDYALKFAYENRKRMIELCKKIFFKYYDCKFEEMINIHHNYAALENHFGKNVWVHRKGATSAYKDDIGIIPGSQGTSSYIVKGLGSEYSFKSCSHGAGRRMGRKKARDSLDLEYEKKILDDKGILHSINEIDDLDEASSAYKDIDVVMEEQKDLVSVVTKLEPLAVVKG